VYANTSLRQIAEHLGDLGTGARELFVGVAFEVAERG
jgi:hypothetical protein